MTVMVLQFDMRLLPARFYGNMETDPILNPASHPRSRIDSQ